MKKLILFIFIIFLFSSCKTTEWTSFNPGKGSKVTKHPVKRNGHGIVIAPKFKPCIVKSK